MPSPAASALTRAHRTQQQQISAAVVRAILRQWGVLDAAELDRTWPLLAQAISAVIVAGHATSAQTAAAYLTAHARLDGVSGLRPVAAQKLATDKVETVLRVTGPVVIKKATARGMSLDAASRSALVQVSGAAQRLSMSGGRGTVEATVRRSSQIVGYRRVTSGKACAFCALLASRGSIYKDETTAVGQPYHDHCDCTSEPLYRREQDPPEVRDLAERYEQAQRDHPDKSPLNAWRTAYEAG